MFSRITKLSSKKILATEGEVSIYNIDQVVENLWEWTWMVKSVEADTKEVSHVWLCRPLRISFKLWLYTFQSLKWWWVWYRDVSQKLRLPCNNTPLQIGKARSESVTQNDDFASAWCFWSWFWFWWHVWHSSVFQVFKTNHSHNI